MDGARANESEGSFGSVYCLWKEEMLGYIGPGAGLGFLGSLLAVLAVFLVGIFGLILYPLRLILALIRKRSGRQNAAVAPETVHKDAGCNSQTEPTVGSPVSAAASDALN